MKEERRKQRVSQLGGTVGDSFAMRRPLTHSLARPADLGSAAAGCFVPTASGPVRYRYESFLAGE